MRQRCCPQNCLACITLSSSNYGASTEVHKCCRNKIVWYGKLYGVKLVGPQIAIVNFVPTKLWGIILAGMFVAYVLWH